MLVHASGRPVSTDVPRTGIPPILATRIGSRLQSLALFLIAVLTVLWLGVNAVEGQLAAEFRRPAQWLPPALTVAVSVGVIWLSRRWRHRPERLARVGLAYMVVCAYGVTFGTYWETFFGVPGELITIDRVGFSGSMVWLFGYVALVPSRLRDLAVALPLHQGRETFLADRARATREQLEALLQLGRPDEAFAVARRARSRAVRHLQRFDRLGQLSPEERDRWDAAISAYRRGRKVPKPDDARLRSLLDDAFAVLEVAPARGGLRAPTPGELWLAYHPLPRGWAAFGATAERVLVHRIGHIDPEASPEALAERLLSPFADQLAAATRARVLPYGALRDVDFHALPWRGAPLVAALPVAYPLDLPPGLEAQPGGRRAVGVADPLGDLPGAWREARTVRDALEARRWSVLTLGGSKASGAALRASLWDAGILHYAGHGVFAGRGGWDSALRLADQRLTVGDILALPRLPRRVVLSGCETARTGRDAPLASVSLAHAFLAGGTEEVVAAVRPVDDAVATRLVGALYAGERDEPVDAAVRRAQLALRATAAGVANGRLRGVGAAPLSKDADWAAFRALLR